MITVLCTVGGCASHTDPEVQRFHDLLRRSDGHPAPLAYPEILVLAESLFGPPAVEIQFRTVESSNENVRVTSSGTIWYSSGQLFVEYEPGSTSTESDENNYATIGEQLVSWKPGSDRGESFVRFEGDTETLLWYLIDPAIFKSSIYGEYLQDPAQFRRVPTPNGEWLQFRDSEETYLGIEVEDSPLWLRSLRVQHEADSVTFEVQIDRPRALTALPARLSTLASGVSFDPPGRTIKGCMKYL